MNAKEFSRIAAGTLRPPTIRKTVNLARKLGLRDTWDEIYNLGYDLGKVAEFVLVDDTPLSGQWKMREKPLRLTRREGLSEVTR